MNLLFVVFEALSNHNGISKKILAQVQGFKNNGIRVRLSSLRIDIKKPGNYESRVIDDQILDTYSEYTLINRIQRIAKFGELYNRVRKDEIDIVYIRYVHIANPFFNRFIKKLKKLGITVLLEVPTYPYDHEYKNVKISNRQKLFTLTERIYRKKLSKYVDRIITVQNYDKIFGIRTIKISNGIDIDSIPIIRKQKLNTDSIQIIGVASLNIAHGYDRVIHGMNLYYLGNPNIEVYFNIVGDKNSVEARKYMLLVDKYNLHKYVVFHDKKYGIELDDIFNQCDIGVGCLGNHRKGIIEAKSLKNREYCARGLPFVYSEIDSDFDDKPFIIKESADDSPLDISKLINFIEAKTYSRNEIREFAKTNLTWEIQFKNLLNEIGLV